MADAPAVLADIGGRTVAFAHVVQTAPEEFHFGETGVEINPGEYPPDRAFDTLHIVATTQPEGKGGMLLLAMPYAGTPPGIQAVEGRPATVLYYPDGPQPPYWSSDLFDVGQSLSDFAFDGKEGRVKGVFSARLCVVPEFDAEPDRNQCRDAKVAVDVPVTVLN